MYAVARNTTYASTAKKKGDVTLTELGYLLHITTKAGQNLVTALKREVSLQTLRDVADR